MSESIPENYHVIVPEELKEQEGREIPQSVIDVFNEFIVKNWSNDQASFTQGDIIRELAKYGFTKTEIIVKHYLDIDAIFEAYGWLVSWKKGHEGNDDARFTFRAAAETI